MKLFDEYVEINNSRQNIMTMSTDPANPVLLIVHGGPGCPDRPLLLKYSSSLAAYYTVVCWDQRGSGLSYMKGRLTIDAMLDDLRAITEYLREKYQQDKIYIAGHSWGAYLGLRFASLHPEYIAYYIGTGQEISYRDSALDKHLYVKAEAEKRNDRRTLKALERFGEPADGFYRQNDVKTKGYVGRKVSLHSGYFYKSGPSLASYFLLYVRLYFRHYGLRTFQTIAGIFKTLHDLVPQMRVEDSISGINELKVPVLLISGEEDMICPVVTARRWFEGLTAPQKEYVIIRNASHMVNFERPEEWNSLLIGLLQKQNGAD